MSPINLSTPYQGEGILPVAVALRLRFVCYVGQVRFELTVSCSQNKRITTFPQPGANSNVGLEGLEPSPRGP